MPVNVNAKKALQPSFTKSFTSSLFFFFEIASFNYSQSLYLYTNQSKLYFSSVVLNSLHSSVFILGLHGS